MVEPLVDDADQGASLICGCRSLDDVAVLDRMPGSTAGDPPPAVRRERLPALLGLQRIQGTPRLRPSRSTRARTRTAAEALGRRLEGLLHDAPLVDAPDDQLVRLGY
jgi:hypothetical protein